MSIQNIILDLGGVILDVDYQKTRDAFIGLGIVDFDTYYQQSFSNPLFERLEKGLISDEAFYDHFRKDTGTDLNNDQIRDAWNAMLGGFRPDTVAMLPVLKSSYKTYLLSNTNNIHYQAFIDIHRATYGHESFNDHFHAAYYSHIIHERKPEASAYQKVLSLIGARPEETLFVDDTLKNIEGAKAVGIQTLLLQAGVPLEQALAAHGLLNL